MKTVLVLNGPNLNLLGVREPAIYGEETLDELVGYVAEYARSKDVQIRAVQSNHEGVLIDELHAARLTCDGIIFNPGAYTHYSYALRDAVEAIGLPCVEVHLSDINSREEFRRTSVIEPVCIAQVSGLGKRGYCAALDILLGRIS